jgi:glycosyltransferase involved in cell wall biosynthesis
MRASVLVLSSEPVGERMAGPAIRAAELARALAGEHEVTLAAPGAPGASPSGASTSGAAPFSEAEPRTTALRSSTVLDRGSYRPSIQDTSSVAGGVRLLDAGFEDYERLVAAAREHDVIVAQELPPTLLGRLADLPARLVLDLYNPIVIEVLEAVAARPARAQRRIQGLIAARALAQCAVADLVVCASERQRDLWLGGMALGGLIELDAYRRDPSLRSLIEVVPFGIPEGHPPEPTGAIRAAFPAIGERERVLLWAGGIWGWLDPATPIRAMAQLEDAHLVFMGIGRPGLEQTGQEAFAHWARELARAEGLEGERVHFNEGWVPYAERGAWLAEAELGLSAHLDHLEARFSFRARILDYLWAELPVVTSRGDALGDLVEARGLGHAVEPGDVDGFAASCALLLDDSSESQAARARIADLRPSLVWSEAARPLVDWCGRIRELPPRQPRRDVLRRAARAQYARALAETLETEGLWAVARRVGRRLRRVVRRG